MAEQLKNVYTEDYIKNLAFKIKENYKEFDINNFINSIFDKSWENLELKARMRHIAISIHKYLPLSYKKQLEVLKPVSKDFSSFEAMFFQDFVEVYGLDDFESSMKALEVFTQDSSSEFAIRQFILKYEDKTMNQMKLWSQSSNEHLRRLSSEGCRPRLPWAIALPKFKKEPKKVLEIIELLKDDKSLYVRKSVANNLNDISKDNPNLVIEFVKANLGKTKELDWICKHASRTLLKKGDIEFDTSIKTINYENNQFNLILENKDGTTKEHQSQALLYATGRESNTDTLKLENTSIEIDERGFIKRDEFFETNAKGVYVVGDASGKHMLQHAAAYEINHLGKILLEDCKEALHFKYMPHAVFTEPEISSVGITEQKAKDENIEYVTSTTNWLASAKALSLRLNYPVTKFIINPKNYEILGCHMIGPESSTMMHQVLAVMHIKNDIRQLKEMLYIHPALSEALLPAAVAAVKEVEEYKKKF